MGAVVELDPLFLKALGYFRSKQSDAPSKLKILLDETLDHLKSSQGSSDPDKLASSSFNKSVFKKSVSEDCRKDRDLAQKRQFDKIQKDLDLINQETSKKVCKGTSPNGTTFPSSASFSAKHESPLRDLMDQSHYGKSSQLQLPADDFEREMEGLACAVCKQISTGSKNQLVECQECHNLYHQDCHQPSVNDQEISDPRCIWYCARCKRNMKKQVKQHVLKAQVASGNLINQHRGKSPVSVTKNISVTPFKRQEVKTSVGHAPGGTSMQGWAALSGRPISAHSRSQEEQTKISESKMQSNHKPIKDKISQKLHKNHTKSAPKFSVSDQWAEALGAKSPQAELKANLKQGLNNSKYSSNASLPRTANSQGSVNAKVQHVYQNASGSAAHAADRTAPYPKASASMSAVPRITNSRSSTEMHDNAARRLQKMKKKPINLHQKRGKV